MSEREKEPVRQQSSLPFPKLFAVCSRFMLQAFLVCRDLNLHRSTYPKPGNGFKNGRASTLAGTSFTVCLQPRSPCEGYIPLILWWRDLPRLSVQPQTWHGAWKRESPRCNARVPHSGQNSPNSTSSRLWHAGQFSTGAQSSGQQLTNTTRGKRLRARQFRQRKRVSGRMVRLETCRLSTSGAFLTGSKNQIIGSSQAASGQKQIQDHQSGSHGLSLPVAQAF
jgi:hypothetical protein